MTDTQSPPTEPVDDGTISPQEAVQAFAAMFPEQFELAMSRLMIQRQQQRIRDLEAKVNGGG